MMQTQTQVPPALQMLMSMGAQPTAPGPMGQPIPTIATQKVEQQAQGLEALMPGVRQQAMQSAQAAQPVTQAQLQQALQQRAPGIAGLPAENMQFAEGGVVGYAGPDGSYVEDPEAIALDELRVAEARRRREAKERQDRATFLEAAGAPQAAQYVAPQTVAPRATTSVPLPSPEAQAMMRQQGPRTGIAAIRPTAPRTQLRQEENSPATMLPDTRESTAVNPSEAALQYAQTQGAIKELGERLRQRPEESQAEKDYRAAAMAEYQRGLGSLTSSQERFEKAKQERLASQEGRGLSDLASFLSRAGGAGSLFRGLGQAQIGMEPVFAARAAEEQKFREQELAFKDRLDERRGIVENLKLATLKNDAEAQRAWANELRKNDAEMTRLGITLGTERMKELSTAERSREEAASRAKEGELNRANAIELERMRRATADRPGETERIFNRFNELKAKDPAAAEQYLQSIERIKGLGRGVEEKAEFSRLRQQATMLQNELKSAMEADPLGKSQRVADLRVRLDGIYKQLGGEASPTGAPTPAAGQPIYARNPTTNERIMSTDGGKTWKPA